MAPNFYVSKNVRMCFCLAERVSKSPVLLFNRVITCFQRFDLSQLQNKGFLKMPITRPMSIDQALQILGLASHDPLDVAKERIRLHRQACQILQSTLGVRKTPTKRYLRSETPPNLRINHHDRILLGMLAEQRLMTSNQLANCTGRHANSVNRRLREFYDGKLVARREISNSVSDPLVYSLTDKGAKLIGLSKTIPAYRSSQYFLHHLAVTDVFVATATQAEKRGFQYRWWREDKLLVHASEGNLSEPDKVNHPSFKTPQSVLPDALLCLTKGGETRFFLIEVDMGTHPQTVWQDRSVLYPYYTDLANPYIRNLQTRLEIAHPNPGFQFLIITKADTRANSTRRGNIMKIIKKSSPNPEMFLSSTLGLIDESSFFGRIWYDVSGDLKFLW